MPHENKKIVRRLNVTMLLPCFFLLFVAQSIYAKQITTSGEIDFGKLIASFKYTYYLESSDGKKESWLAHLKGDGKFYVSGLYIGNSPYDCTDRGGEAQVKLNDDRRRELMKLAIAAFNENESGPEPKLPGASETGPQLYVELGNQMGFVVLTRFLNATEKFRQVLDKEVMDTFDQDQARYTALSISAKAAGNKLHIKLKNIGNADAVIALPKLASDRFYFRADNNKVGLVYAKKQKAGIVKLKSGKELPLEFKLPQGIDVTKGVFIFDNKNPTEETEKPETIVPVVSICAYPQ